VFIEIFCLSAKMASQRRGERTPHARASEIQMVGNFSFWIRGASHAPLLPGEGQRVAKASQGGPPTLAAQRKVRSVAEACSEAKAGG
jgi:hypothetical protein